MAVEGKPLTKILSGKNDECGTVLAISGDKVGMYCSNSLKWSDIGSIANHNPAVEIDEMAHFSLLLELQPEFSPWEPTLRKAIWLLGAFVSIASGNHSETRQGPAFSNPLTFFR